jgi:nucleotide-binding universal stress UspA family protein
MNKILLTIDVNYDSNQVIRYALELAAKFNAQIYVLHVMATVDAAVLNSVALVMGADKLAKLNKQNEAELADQLQKKLEDIVKAEAELMDVKIPYAPHIEVHHGDAAPMILAVADRIDADMIVMGSHSKKKMHYAFLGSVAEKVLHKSTRIVTIVPPRGKKSF